MVLCGPRETVSAVAMGSLGGQVGVDVAWNGIGARGTCGLCGALMVWDGRMVNAAHERKKARHVD